MNFHNSTRRWIMLLFACSSILFSLLAPQPSDAAIGSCSWLISSSGLGQLTSFAVDREQTALGQLRFGEPYSPIRLQPAREGFLDFDGNLRSDVFRVQARSDGLWQWQYYPNGGSGWQSLAYAVSPIDDLRFGDFNGDGKTDIFTTIQRTDGAYDWLMSAGGVASFVSFGVDLLSVKDLRFGDFNGDGITDIFSVKQRPDALWQWRVSYGGTAAWQSLAYAVPPLEDLRFGDFDADGKTDIFTTIQRTDGAYDWLMSAGGVASFVSLGIDPLSVNDLRFGDFNGDAKTDMFSVAPRTDGLFQWRVSYSGVGAWTDIGYGSAVLEDLRFGLFDSGSTTDVLMVNCQSVAQHRAPDSSADAVLGQIDFEATGENRAGTPAANTLFGPAASLVTPKGALFIADYRNSRVLMWANTSSFTNGEAATLALGQPNLNDVGPDPFVSCGIVSAQSLCGPESLAYDPTGDGTLYVADTHNHRVLAYSGPFGPASGQVASKVFGQPGMSANSPNRGGGSDATGNSLYFPRGLAFNLIEKKLFVADDFNRRVLIFNIADGDTTADGVLGKATLNDDGGNCVAASATNFCSPKGLTYNQISDTLYVADYYYARVLQYLGPFSRNNQVAIRAFGQPAGSLTSQERSCQYLKGANEAISNKVNTPIAADRLCNPLDVATAADGTLYISDATNSRVLAFYEPHGPIAEAMMPDAVFGQADTFTSGDKNKPDPAGLASALSLHRPMGMALTGNSLFVSDFENNRVLFFAGQQNQVFLPTIQN